MPYASYIPSQAPSWLRDQYGTAWLAGIGASLDVYVQQYIAGSLSALPDYAPADALGVIGDELGIDRGPFETDLQYRARLVSAWIAWKYAGTPLGMLVALYWAGFGGGLLVQQNGVGYSLSGTPVAGADSASLLVTTTLSTLNTDLHSSVNPARSIQAGTPWWTFDSNTDFCSRFAVLFPGPALPSAFRTDGVATFTGVEDGSPAHPWPTVTWNNVFADTTYLVKPGAVVVTGGGGGVLVAADAASKTTAGIRIIASAPFTGTVDVIAWQAGANPFADLHAQDLARLQNVIKKWRPAKATCVGVYALVQGAFWGWPVRTWVGGYWGPSTVVSFPGA